MAAVSLSPTIQPAIHQASTTVRDDPQARTPSWFARMPLWMRPWHSLLDAQGAQGLGVSWGGWPRVVGEGWFNDG